MRSEADALAGRLPERPGELRFGMAGPGFEGEWFLRPDRVVLHLHGGGYVMGSPETVRPIAVGIADILQGPVLAVDYRLAPEHPFPAALEDATAAYQYLLERGCPGSRIIVSGDSAGGGLALALLVRLRDEGIELPRAAVALSPWTDLSLQSPSLTRGVEYDPQVKREFLADAAEHYLAGADPLTPLASPVFADLTGLPPILVQVGADEALMDDAIRFCDAARAAGVDVTLECWDAMFHLWHAHGPRLPEAERAFEAIRTWLEAR